MYIYTKATIINIIVTQAIVHANFPLHNSSYNNGHVTVLFFSSRMCIYFCNQCLMSIFWYLWSSCSFQSLVVHTRRMVFLLTQISSSSRWEHQVESCAGFVFSEDSRHFLWVLHCFSIFRTAQTWISMLISCQLTKVAQARPFLFPWQCQLCIGYELLWLEWAISFMINYHSHTTLYTQPFTHNPLHTLVALILLSQLNIKEWVTNFIGKLCSICLTSCEAW